MVDQKEPAHSTPLYFITSTDPNHTRSTATRKEVRSHALRYHHSTKPSRGRKQNPHSQSKPFRKLAPSRHEGESSSSDHDRNPTKEPYPSQCERLVYQPYDPSMSLPHFTDPAVDVAKLCHSSMVVFGSAWSTRPPKYRELFKSSRLLFLSSICKGAILQEIMQGASDSLRISSVIRGDLLSLINQKLVSSPTAIDDALILGLENLCHFELYHASFETLQMHFEGFELLVQKRGGYEALRQTCPALMKGIDSKKIWASILHEVALPTASRRRLLSRLNDEDAHHRTSTPDINMSPLSYRPLDSRPTTKVSTAIPDILSSISQLTTLILANNGITRTIESPNDGDLEYISTQLQIQHLQNSLLSLPSATEANHAGSGDYIYESLRLTSIIYATSLAYKMPFSASISLMSIKANTPNTIQALAAAINKTPHQTHWNEFDLSSCLMWIGMVGGAAARRATDAEDIRCRKWLYLTGIRTAVVACRGDREASGYGSLFTLLKVQEAISLDKKIMV